MDVIREIWPFVCFSLFSAVLFQAIKKTLFIPKNLKTQARTYLLFLKKTFPAFPPLLGVLVGLIPHMPTASFIGDTAAARSLYYAAAGVCSTWVFDVVKTLVKTRVGTIFSK